MRTVTRSDRVANKDEQWLSIHEAAYEQRSTDACENMYLSLAVGNKLIEMIVIWPLKLRQRVDAF